MNFRAAILCLILGLSSGVIADINQNQPVIAQPGLPLGTFEDPQWSITLDYYNNALSYYGMNKKTGANLELRGAKVAGTPQRRVYIWTNGDTTYQVTWQPSDPNFIRIQVFDGRKREVLNRLLRRIP